MDLILRSRRSMFRSVQIHEDGSAKVPESLYAALDQDHDEGKSETTRVQYCNSHRALDSLMAILDVLNMRKNARLQKYQYFSGGQHQPH